MISYNAKARGRKGRRDESESVSGCATLMDRDNFAGLHK